MFPRNPENKAWCLPQPAKGASSSSTRPNRCRAAGRVCACVHVYSRVQCVHRRMQALCESVCMHTYSV